MHLEIVGPTLGVLAKQTGVDIAGISTILVIRGAGYMFGNIVGALTQKIAKKYPEILLTVSFLVAAISKYLHFNDKILRKFLLLKYFSGFFNSIHKQHPFIINNKFFPRNFSRSD